MTYTHNLVGVPGTDVRLTRLGMGCARMFAGAEAKVSRRLIETALEGGIGHFDTAASYSFGQSEEIVGEVLADHPHATIATKVGIKATARKPGRMGALYRKTVRPVLSRMPGVKARLLALRAGATAPGSASARPAPRVLGECEIRASLEGSLKRLRRDRVDLLLVHEPEQFIIDDALKAVFETLVTEGLVRAYGLAYGAEASVRTGFGAVLQARIPRQHARLAPEGVARIFHGVLRRTPDPEPGGLPAGPTAVRTVLARSSNSQVLFSASHPDQIRDVIAQTKIEEL